MKKENIDFLKLFQLALRKWYLFAICLTLFMAGAWYYLKTTPKKYEAGAMLLINDEKKSGQLSKEDILKDMGLATVNKNLENEIQILSSIPLVESVVKKLNLNYQYIGKSGMRPVDLYQNSPIKVTQWLPKNEATVFDAEFTQVSEFSYQLLFAADELGPEEVKYIGRYNKDLQLPHGVLNVTRDSLLPVSGPINILLYPTINMAVYIKDELNIQMAGFEASTVMMSMKDTNPFRARDILNALAEAYNDVSMESKTVVLKNTLAMLDDRIQKVAQELAVSEQREQSFKSQNNLMELNTEGNLIMKELTESNKKITDTEIQIEVLNNIDGFLKNNEESFEFVPTNSTVTNLTLSQQITDFNNSLTAFNQVKNDKGPAHPDWILAENAVKNHRKSIIASIANIKSDLNITKQGLTQQRTNLETRLQGLPFQQKQLTTINRQKDIKENLYLYLLEKREETAISLTAIMPTGNLLEPALASDDPVSPVPAQIWLIAGFLGLAIPAGFVFLIDQLSDRIETEEELKAATNVPIAGIVGHTGKKEPLIIKERSYTIAAELFRLLRTNLDYVIPEKNLQTVLVTSSTEGEGKSYISLNLAMTQAIAGKKVLLLELDLRRPKQLTNIRLDKTNRGVVNYLTDRKLKASRIIQNSGLHRNFDVILSGPRPANPNELLLSGRLRELIDELKTKYDFIILDAPPVGIVSDALQMKDLTEATMYVVRSEYTTRRQLQIIEDIAKNSKLPNPFIVLNDVHLKRNGYYGGGYSYFGNSDYFQQINEGA